MKLLHRQSLGLMSVLFALLVLVAGCAPNANAQLVSPQLGEQLAAIEAGNEIVIPPTPVPLKFVELTPEQVTAGLTPEFAAALAAGDPSAGEQLTLLQGCQGCHSPDDPTGGGRAGPTWVDVADHAANRVPGMSPANYFYTSITSPGAFVVPNFPNGLMPADYSQRLSTEDLANIVAYLLTHHE